MAEIKEPQPVLPVVGLITTSGFTADVLEELRPDLGMVVLRSAVIPFSHTTYYNAEMGDALMRQWCAFGNLIMPDSLIQLKHRTNDLEQKHLNEDRGRKVNIDPGLVSMSSLVLASTKNYAHRIYLGKGIYAEVTLIYRGHRFVPLDWTYPDYREIVALDFFNMARGFLKEKLVARDGIKGSEDV
jgi:hypothetical protein